MRRRIAADRRHRGGGLRRRVARAEGLQRSRDPRQGRCARAAPRRASRRSGRHATAATSRRESTGSSSARSTSPTAIRSAPRSSTTSSAGWSASAPTPPSCWRRSGRRCCAATGTWFPRTATSSRPARPRNDAVMQPESAAGMAADRPPGLDRRPARAPSDEDKLYTFWDYTAGCWQRDLGFRLDHLLCSPEAADRLHGRGRRQLGARRGESERPRADLGGAGRLRFVIAVEERARSEREGPRSDIDDSGLS